MEEERPKSLSFSGGLLGGEISSVPIGGKTIGDYEIGKSIGQGAFGKVKLGIHKHSNERVALKFVKKANLKTQKQVNGLIREVKLMRLLNHPHIVKVYDVIETDDEVVIVMEYVSGGELFDYIVAHGKLKTDEARKFFRQLVSAIDYCHKNSITHRDLKPENLLVDENDNLKITDFGFSNFYQEDRLLDTFCGSPCYMPPEMIQGIKYAGPKVDVWGMGIILYSLITGQLPFTGEDVNELYQNITKARFRCPHYVDADTRAAILQMLTANFEERVSVEQIMWSPWVCQGYDGAPWDYMLPRERIETIDEEAFAELTSFHMGSTNAELREQLLRNEPGPVTSTYYLILENGNKDLPSPRLLRESPRGSITETLAEESFHGSSSGESFKSPTSQLRASNAKRSPSLDKIASGTSPPSRNRKLSLTEAIPKILNFRPRFPSLTGTIEQTLKVKKGVFTVKTTSTKSEEVLAAEVERVLRDNGINYHTSGTRIFNCQVDERGSESNFEIMLCHIEKLGMNGLYFKRIRGNFWIHKQITDKLVSQMKL